MRIGILGPGAIGSMIASLLYKKNYQVTCFGTENSVESIQQKGIQIRSQLFGDFLSYPHSETCASSNVDILFVTVKSPALKTALKRVANAIGEDTVIVSLLNGIGHREVIRGVFGEKVVVGTIGAIEVELSEERDILHRSLMFPHIEIASDADVCVKKLYSLSKIINSAGLSVAIGGSENEVIWRKLTRLSPIATMTAYTQSSLGELRSDHKNRLMLEAVVKEICQIAQKQSLSFSPDEVMLQIDSLPSSLTTSMQRDIRLGKPSEIDSILEMPIEIGISFGLSLEVMRYCYSQITSQFKFDKKASLSR